MILNLHDKDLDLNWWLIVSACVIIFILMMASVYILVYFQHEEDKNCAILPKIVVVLCLTLSMVTILLLPMDVANRDSNSGLGGQMPMAIFWQIAYMSISVIVIVIIPFFIFYYEEDDDSRAVQVKNALWATAGSFTIASLLIGLLYAFAGFSNLPVKAYADTNSNIVGMNLNYDILESGAINVEQYCVEFSGLCGSHGDDTTVKFRVSFVIYTVSLLSIVGWLLFIVFAGVGLVALPLDLINSWRFRPQPIDLKAFAESKLKLAARARNLKQIGAQLQKEGRHRQKSRQDKKLFNKFRQAVYFLEHDYERLMLEFKNRGGNPLYYWWLLFVGVLCLCTSLLWILHIIIYMFPSPYIHPFLNTMLEDLDNFFGLAGTICYGIFAFYLLWATIKGNFKMGLNVVFFTIHPMEVGKTFMNSFLFNCGLILLCTLPTVMFCTQAFSIYARFTAVDLIFGTQTRYLQGFGKLWEKNVFIYILFIFAWLSFFYSLFRPVDKSKEDELDQDIRKREMYAV